MSNSKSRNAVFDPLRTSLRFSLVAMISVCLHLTGGCSNGTSVSEVERANSSELEEAAKVVSLQQAEESISEYIENANRLESEFKFAEAVKVWQQIEPLVVNQAGKESWQATNARLSLATARRQAAFGEDELNTMREFAARRATLDENLKNRDVEAAIIDLKWMLDATQSLLGDNSHTLGRQNLSLGQLLVQLGRLKEAQQYLQAALEINRSQLGDVHPETDTNLFLMGQSSMQMGEHEQGVSYLEQSEQISRKLWGDEHPTTASRKNDLGVAYHSAGRMAEAERQLLQALALRKQLLKPTDATIGETLRNLGVVYLDTKQLKKSAVALKEAVDIFSNSMGEANGLTLDSRSRLATAKMLSKEYLAAEGQLRQVVHQFETHADHTRELANACFQLAVALGHQGQYHEAEPLLKRALNIQRNTLGQWHPKTVQTLKTLAVLYQRTGENEQAKSIIDSLGRLHSQNDSQQ